MVAMSVTKRVQKSVGLPVSKRQANSEELQASHQRHLKHCILYHIRHGDCLLLEDRDTPMRRMNFRQRIAWLLVVIYLALTCAIVYYLFEISDRFNQFALDHVERFHKLPEAGSEGDDAKATDHRGLWYFWLHFTDIPLWTWILLAVLPYLQVFFSLMAMTKANPQLNTAFMWPIYSYMKLRNWFYGTPPDDVKYAVPVELNGKTLVDT